MRRMVKRQSRQRAAILLPARQAEWPTGLDMAAQGVEVGRLVTDARTNGMAYAALAAALFVATGALSSLMLPNPREQALVRSPAEALLAAE